MVIIIFTMMMMKMKQTFRVAGQRSCHYFDYSVMMTIVLMTIVVIMMKMVVLVMLMIKVVKMVLMKQKL